MRDAHRMKEKYDVSLDGRQVGSLLVGGIIVLGTVFVLGVVVGKKLATNEQTQAAPDILTALDQKAETTLTFQEELTRTSPLAAPVAVAKPVPMESKKDEPKKEEPKRENPTPPPAPAPAPVAEAPAAAPARQEGEATTVASANSWTLQLSASQSKDEADKFASRLKDRGYAPFIAKAEVPGKGTWYRVRMGGFPTKEAATRYLQDFKRETQLNAFVAANQ